MAQQSIESVARKIRSTVGGLKPGSQRRYPARLRRRIADYAKRRISQGVSRSRVCAELGVSYPTLTALLTNGSKSARFRPVRVVADVQRVPIGSQAVVKLPGGVIVEGLDVAGVAALMRALS
jgi:hypothetical protein